MHRQHAIEVASTCGTVNASGTRRRFSGLQFDIPSKVADPRTSYKRKLARLIRDAGRGLQLSEHLHIDGAEMFEHACKLGCEGIVSKKLGSRYVSGPTDHWIKVKNPAAPAIRREAGEDWGRRRWR
jgi:ATP-dependent DNA ligase